MKLYHRFVSSVLLLTLLFIPTQFVLAQNEPPPSYKNPKLSIAKRVDDLVSQMTPEEKISQMQNAASAISRLDIPEYEWWNEALHGVARAG